MTDLQDAGGVAEEGLAAETELKFELTSAELRRLAKHPAFEQAPRVRKLISTYYDTPDFDLRKAGLSLRVRKVDGGYVQTVKRNRSADIFDRDEWEAAAPGPKPLAEAIAVTPAAKVLKKADSPLVAVFATNIERASRLWTSDGAVVEISVDKGYIRAGESRERLWELELELKAGEPAALYALARDLFDKAPIRLSLTTKGERGYRLASPGAERRSRHPPLLPQMSVAEAFSAVLRSCLVQVVASSDEFRRTAAAESVHQTRVGLRRTRTALRIFRPAAEDARSAWLNGEIRWLAGELGPARSLDVFRDEMFDPGVLSDPKAAARYAEALEKTRGAAYRRVEEALASARFSKLMLELALWVEDGAWRHTADPDRAARLQGAIGGFAVDALDHLRRVVRKRGREIETLDPDRRHKLRIRAKRLRYATEFFARALGEEGRRRKRFAGALKALQDSLGRLNDIAHVGEVAQLALGGAAARDLTFAAGELAGRVRSHEPAVLIEAAAAYEEFADAKPYWPKARREKPDIEASEPGL
jgi:inorganic triphosphatase YgiF